MLEQLLTYLGNWFALRVWRGSFTVSGGELVEDVGLQDSQWFRIRGSVFNDGLHQFPAGDLVDEGFEGQVWALAVPAAVVELAERIEAWQEAYGDAAASPYQSESFGGYSYSKGGSGESGAATSTWQAAFAAELRRWRKL